MAEVPVRVGKRTKWISGLTEKTTCKVSGELIAASRRFTSSLNAAAAAWSDFAQNRFPFEPESNMQSELVQYCFESRILGEYNCT